MSLTACQSRPAIEGAFYRPAAEGLDATTACAADVATARRELLRADGTDDPNPNPYGEGRVGRVAENIPLTQ